MNSDEKTHQKLLKKKWIVLGIVLFIGILSISKGFEKEVTIAEGDKKKKVTVWFCNVGDVLEKANIKLGKHDQISEPLGASARNKMVLKIKRAYPVTVSCDGKTKNVMTAYEKVKDILKEHNIILGKMDQIQPALNETVSRNGTIQIIRIKEKMISEKVPIPYESDIRYNDELEQGKIQLIQEGQNGEKEVQYKVVYKDGEEISKDIIKEEIITSAINEIVEKGTARYIATSRGNIRANKVLVMTATAYNSGYASTGKRPGHPYYGKTCIGTQAKPGVVAVDPRVIPLRTKLYIKSIDGSADYGFASAEDVGGAIKGNKIDLYFENPNDIRKFGRRKVEVYILE